MNKFYGQLVLLFLSISSFAQTSIKHYQFEPVATVSPSTTTTDWNPVLQNLEMPEPDGAADEWIKEKAKHTADSLYGGIINAPRDIVVKRSIAKPVIGRNFYGNPYNYSVPNDNDMAISNGNKVISVINSTMRAYDLNIDTAYPALSLFSFFSGLGLPNEHFDPKVIYDPQADRFILMCLNGFTDSTSYIALAFSKTNDPRQEWTLYQIPGNPYNDTLWTDYPMISITQEHLYLTVNLLKNNESWQNGFVRTIVWQFEKSDGYDGQILNTNLISNFKFNNKNIRNLCPVRNGNELFSGTAYFLSDRNLSVSNDSIFLVKLPDSMGIDSSAIEVQLLKANVRYHIPPDAQQTPPRKLQTNDARILGAFKQNNLIQFVSNTRDTVFNKAALYHGVIDLSTASPSITTYTISNDTVEYGYPNIAYAGTGTADNTAIIGINYTAANIFPACGAIMTDGGGQYSDLLTIRKGDNFISVLSTPEQRWGDYSGAQRKYNENGVVWVALTYGAQSKKQNTWIAELGTQPFLSIPYASHKFDINSLYPLPAQNTVACNFTLTEEVYLTFSIIDAAGCMVLELFRERAFPGENIFSFNTTSLSNGSYFLIVKNNIGELLTSKKFIVMK
jgi:hypothetical protein